MNLKDKLKTLPISAGIYKFLDKNQKVIYVGKAKDLKKRVKNYFQTSTKLGPKNRKLVENTVDLEWVETNTEEEAILLETNFIKELRPKYNILMKDDKNFVYIKITLDEDFPRIQIVRKVEKDNAKYFGPKTSKSDVDKTLKLLSKIFSFRDCNYEIRQEGEKVVVKGVLRNLPCLQYHIKKCAGPCIGKISTEEYQKIIDQIINFLKGRTNLIEKQLKIDMKEAALNQKFEKAVKIRDNLFAVQKITTKQIITEANFEQRDVFAFVNDLGKTFFTLLQIRNGKMIGQENFVVEGESLNEESEKQILTSFLEQYYTAATDIPSEVLLPVEVENIVQMKKFLSELANKQVKLLIPQKGKKNALIALAQRNAVSFAKANRIKWMEERSIDYDKLLDELQKAIKAPQKIRRIECFDISHLGGTDTVGSMVVFMNGKSRNADYRHFKLRSLEEGEVDDYKAMREVLARRLKYIAYDDKKILLGDKYKLRKGKKADVEFVQKTAKKAELDLIDFEIKDFLVIEKLMESGVGNKKNGSLSKKKKKVAKTQIVGFVRIKQCSDKVREMGTLWIKEKERDKGFGALLCEELIRKSKLNKVYCHTDISLVPFYARIGFQEIYQTPKEIEARLVRKKINMKEYKCLAYIKSKQEQIDKSFASKPDLIVIDGGKGQLSVVNDVMQEFKLEIPLISIAKKEEELFVPKKKTPIPIPKNSEISFLIQRIRDESHRFAITFNQELRSKRMTQSKLDDIPGLGPKQKQKLLVKFGSVNGIKQASLIELTKLVGQTLAQKIQSNLG